MPINQLTEDGFGMIVGSSGSEPFSFGNALQFDGTDDFVNFSTIILSSYSFSCWIKPIGNTYIISGNGSGNGVAYIAILPSPNAIIVRVGATFNYSTFASITDNVWQHLFVRYDGSEINVYINGVAATNNPLARTGSVDFDRLGRLYSLSAYYDQVLDEVAIWNTDIGNQSSNLYNSGNGDYATNYSPANLIAYWRCNETDGATTLTDEQGNYDGTLNNFSTPPAYFIPH